MDPISVPCGTDNMLKVLLPSLDQPPSEPAKSAHQVIETRQNKKGNIAKYCNRAPPTIIEPRVSNDPISAGKLVWIMHDNFPDVPVAAGKAGVSWKSKSSKLGAQCEPGTQWIHVHRVFIPQVPFMFPEIEQRDGFLNDALPPSSRRQKPVKWKSQFLESYIVPTM